MNRPYRRKPSDPVYRPLRIYTRDPSLKRSDGAVTTTQLPFEPLAKPDPAKIRTFLPDPRTRTSNPDDAMTVVELLSSQLFSVCIQVSTEKLEELPASLSPCNLDDPQVAMQNGYAPATGCPRFAAQMAYAVATLTYEHFRRALGRDPSWAKRSVELDDGKLVLVVRDFREPGDPPSLKAGGRDLVNAFYDPSRRLVYFGSFGAAAASPGRSQPGSRVHTGLSHDVIVHEVVHALLDGLKPHLLLPTHPDVLAFHEGFADLIALFMHFTHGDVLKQALLERDGKLDSSLLTELARQFGQTASGTTEALRCGITDQQDPESEVPSKFRYAPYLEPHTLGSVLVSAVFEAFRVVFRRKTKRLRALASWAGTGGDAKPPQVLIDFMADKASDLASQFLTILIRALDYLPPVDVTFGDYLRALITADQDMVPDDPYGYREALVGAFRRYGVGVESVDDLSEESLRWPLQPPIPQVTDRNDLITPIEAAPAPRTAEDVETIKTLASAETAGAAEAAKELFGSIGFSSWEVHSNNDAAEVRKKKADVLLRKLSELGRLCGLAGQLKDYSINAVRGLRRVGIDQQVVLDVVIEISREIKHDGLRCHEGATLIIGADGCPRFFIVKNLSDVNCKARLEAFAGGLGARYAGLLQGEIGVSAEVLKGLHARHGHAGWIQPGFSK